MKENIFVLKMKNQLIIEKYLPHNYTAEKIILSSLLISSEALEIVFRSVKVETFYFQNHQELYQTIIESTRVSLMLIVSLSTFSLSEVCRM